MSKSVEADISDLISTLERIAADVQSTTVNRPDCVVDELDSAITTTTDIITKALPPEQCERWLTELTSLKSASPSAVASSSFGRTGSTTEHKASCNCPITCPQLRVSEATLPSEHHVRCIHGCGVVFCSATCRKKKARDHRPNCEALQRKKILSSLGLNAQPELF